MYVYLKYCLQNLKRTPNIWKWHLIFEKDIGNLKKKYTQNNTRNQENAPKMWKKHLIFEKDNQNLKKTPDIWKRHQKYEKEFYLASMFSSENSLEILFSPKSEKDTRNLKRHPKYETSINVEFETVATYWWI